MLFESVLSVIGWSAIVWLPMLALSMLSMWYLRILGYRTTLMLGVVGVPVHELGHWLMAKLCGHKILHVSLFKPSIDGSLGSVSHQYRVTWFSPFANVLIGLAPLFTGIAAFLLVSQWLRPDIVVLIKALPQEIWSFRDAIQVLRSLGAQLIATGGFWVTTLWLLLSLSLLLFCVPSKADFIGCRSGIIILTLAGASGFVLFPDGMARFLYQVEPYAVLIAAVLWSILFLITLLFLAFLIARRVISGSRHQA